MIFNINQNQTFLLHILLPFTEWLLSGLFQSRSFLAVRYLFACVRLLALARTSFYLWKILGTLLLWTYIICQRKYSFMFAPQILSLVKGTVSMEQVVVAANLHKCATVWECWNLLYLFMTMLWTLICVTREQLASFWVKQGFYCLQLYISFHAFSYNVFLVCYYLVTSLGVYTLNTKSNLIFNQMKADPILSLLLYHVCCTLFALCRKSCCESGST